MLDSDSDLGLEEIGETERGFGWGGGDIRKEYILTWWGVGRTVLELTTQGYPDTVVNRKFSCATRARKKGGIRGGPEKRSVQFRCGEGVRVRSPFVGGAFCLFDHRLEKFSLGDPTGAGPTDHDVTNSRVAHQDSHHMC